jgi:hypothetical protein
LSFHGFVLAPGLLGASFLPKRFNLCFRDFVLSPNLLGLHFFQNNLAYFSMILF